MARIDEIRLMVKIARMYYDQGIRQQEITERLSIHQSTISRLLKRARETNVVRISVAPPPGVYADLEDAIERRFGLREAIVVDSPEGADEEQIGRDLGTAAAFFLETTVKKGMVIGISPWGRALLTMVDVMNTSDRGKGGRVVQILGGIGNGNHHYGTQLCQRLAANIGAELTPLQAPAVVGSAEARRVLSADPSVRETYDWYEKIDLALVGLGSVELPKGGASGQTLTFSSEERTELMQLGAVGDICLRFMDAQGKLVRSPSMNRVMGIDPKVLKQVPRIVGIAGGARNLAIIQACLKGGWINVLILDRQTAEDLLAAK